MSAALLLPLLLLPASPPAAEGEQCYDHVPYEVTPHGYAAADTLRLYAWDPNWSFGDHFSRLIFTAEDGRTTTVTLPRAPGTYRFDAGDIALWTVCKAQTPPAPAPEPPAPAPAPAPAPEPPEPYLPTPLPPIERFEPATPVCYLPGKGAYNADDPRCFEDLPPAPEAPPEAPETLPVTGTGTRLAVAGLAALVLGIPVEILSRKLLNRKAR